MRIQDDEGFAANTSSSTGLDDEPQIIKLANDLLGLGIPKSFQVNRDELTQERFTKNPSKDFQRELIQYLLKNPDAINEPIDSYGSPGHYAARYGLEKLYRVLARFPDFDVDKQDAQGNTHLHLAAYSLNWDLVEFITEPLRPVDYHKENFSNQAALKYLEENRNPGEPNRQKIMQLLHERMQD